MAEKTGNIYQVKRLEDGMIVPLTCTAEDLPGWLAQGYELVEDTEEKNAAADQSKAAKRPAK